MSLKQNGRLVQQLPLRFRGGATLSFEYQETNKSQSRNMFAGDGGIDPKNGLPSGHLPPSSWMLPQQSGGISAFISIIGVGTLTAAGTLGLPTSSTINGTSTFTGSGKLVVQGQANITGVGTITGQLVAPVDGAANLTASGTITGIIVASGSILSLITGDSVMYATPFAEGSLAAEISSFTELSPQSLVEELLDNQDIEAGFSMRESLRIILTALAGKLSGGGTTSIAIRDVNDLKDRIVAVVDTSGNRTAVSYDVSD